VLFAVTGPTQNADVGEVVSAAPLRLNVGHVKAVVPFVRGVEDYELAAVPAERTIAGEALDPQLCESRSL
jgi:hypothetical protein